MKKHFNNYNICWLIVAIVFNIIVFIAPEKLLMFNRFSRSFWIGYIFVMLALAIHYVFVYSFINKKINNTISNTLVVLSCFELPILITIYCVCMFISDFSDWITVIICSLILGFSIVLIVLADSVTNNTVNAYESNNNNTRMMRNLSSKAECMAKNARGTEKEEIAKKIYEAIRYSNPISDKETNEIELDILYKLENNEINEELLGLVNKRNEIIQNRTKD